MHVLTEDFFAPDAAAPEQSHDFDENILSRWPTYPALRSERASEIFARLRPTVLERLKRSAKPNEALVAFDGFLSGLPAGVQLFSLFEANPHLIDLLLDIAGTAPDLARHLSRHASVFDAVLGGDFFSDWPASDELERNLREELASTSDYERKLDLARRWQKELHFRVGVHLLRGLVSAQEASKQYADIASTVIRALWPVVTDQFSTKYGSPPGIGAMIVGMGSLGAQALNARSDLDLIVIYDADGVEFSEGRKQLAARTYYARLTQAMVTALSAPMAEGKLYEVDMRLRPSGNQGPVATSLTSFTDYQTISAWTWEHLALTRARTISGPQELMEQFENFRCELLASTTDHAKILHDTAEMREKIASAKGQGGAWDVKFVAGGLQDIELFAQAASLIAGNSDLTVSGGIECAVSAKLIEQSAANILSETYTALWTVQAVAKLLSENALDPENIGLGGQNFLLRESGANGLSDLKRSLADYSANTRAVIDQALGLKNGEDK